MKCKSFEKYIAVLFRVNEGVEQGARQRNRQAAGGRWQAVGGRRQAVMSSRPRGSAAR
jgi:hypothetical protein